MEERRKLLPPDFGNVFSGYFDSDVIEWEEREGKTLPVQGTIEFEDCVVKVLIYSGMTAEEIIRFLEEALAQWGPEVIGEFNKASNGCWDWDPESEEVLKTIVARMLETARFWRGADSIVGFDVVLLDQRPESLSGGATGRPDLTGKVKARRYDLQGTAVSEIGTFSMDAQGNFRDADGTVLGTVSSEKISLTANGKAKFGPYY